MKWEHSAEVSAGKTVDGLHYYVGKLLGESRDVWVSQFIGPGTGYAFGALEGRKAAIELCELIEAGGKDSRKKVGTAYARASRDGVVMTVASTTKWLEKLRLEVGGQRAA